MGVPAMVVDDEPIIRLDVKEILLKADYGGVLEARNGDEALRLAYEHRPELVIMDVHMPKLNGLQASRQIRKWYDPVIILLTAHYRKEWCVSAREAGASGYVTKPFTEGGLLMSVEIGFEQRRKLRELEGDVARLKGKMEERKIIDRAKGILMSRCRLDEAEAYARLRGRSMYERTSLVKTAEAVIMDFENGIV
ncbi:ANTAR domain-containing response regulator [Gorillibacterium timonense]|uniref:ANTAR domain-containing response regulator n=1 Tax=Gorillibacterium timonense TaxID=1689269 RepID=UPI00071CB4A4|nr:response regulator [Gorillibacterium timonense]